MPTYRRARSVCKPSTYKNQPVNTVFGIMSQYNTPQPVPPPPSASPPSSPIPVITESSEEVQEQCNQNFRTADPNVKLQLAKIRQKELNDGLKKLNDEIVELESLRQKCQETERTHLLLMNRQLNAKLSEEQDKIKELGASCQAAIQRELELQETERGLKSELERIRKAFIDSKNELSDVERNHRKELDRFKEAMYAEKRELMNNMRGPNGNAFKEIDRFRKLLRDEKEEKENEKKRARRFSAEADNLSTKLDTAIIERNAAEKECEKLKRRCRVLEDDNEKKAVYESAYKGWKKVGESSKKQVSNECVDKPREIPYNVENELKDELARFKLNLELERGKNDELNAQLNYYKSCLESNYNDSCRLQEENKEKWQTERDQLELMLSQEKIENVMLRSAKDTFAKNLTDYVNELEDVRAEKTRIETDLAKCTHQLNYLKEQNSKLEENSEQQNETFEQQTKYILRLERDLGRDRSQLASNSTQTVSLVTSMETQTNEPFTDHIVVLKLRDDLAKSNRALLEKSEKNDSLGTNECDRVVKQEDSFGGPSGLISFGYRNDNEIIEISDEESVDEESSDTTEPEENPLFIPGTKRRLTAANVSKLAQLKKKSKNS
ncbi:hypothetical protein Ddc_03597 [Ditylenchus destructor]|nr:hypothetical protein Ddc_03597 [Ditylenchus destructor]